MARSKSSTSFAQSFATIGFEDKLWLTADKLRNNRVAIFSSWQGTAAEKKQPQVDPQGAAMQRRQFGVPPKGNANFAWVQHFIHHLAPATTRTVGGHGRLRPRQWQHVLNRVDGRFACVAPPTCHYFLVK